MLSGLGYLWTAGKNCFGLSPGGKAISPSPHLGARRSGPALFDFLSNGAGGFDAPFSIPFSSVLDDFIHGIL